MSPKAVLPMDSYRLAQYTVTAPCYVCGGGNNFDAELCRHCFAPMALAHQASSQKIRPKMIAVLGASGAGKTVYLGMLTDMLSREASRLQLLARGAFSISLQQNTVAALARGRFPEKTPCEPDSWHWVHCQLRAPRQRKPLELIMPDMAGEALLEELDHPNSYPVVRAFLAKCSGVMILIDGSQLVEGVKQQDFFAMKMLTYLCDLDDHPKTGWPAKPVCLTFTKADECEACFENPAAYARRSAHGLWQHCQERFRYHEFFAAGMAGNCAYRQPTGKGRLRVPLRVEPRGIVEPFEWLVEQLKRQK